MSVFREVEIEWGGRSYTVTPSNRLLRRIEREVPVLNMLRDFEREIIKPSELAFVLAEFLKAGGANVDEDDLFGALVGADAAATFVLAEQVLTALIPVDPAGKKPVAAGKKRRATRSKKTRPN